MLTKLCLATLAGCAYASQDVSRAKEFASRLQQQQTEISERVSDVMERYGLNKRSVLDEDPCIDQVMIPVRDGVSMSTTIIRPAPCDQPRSAVLARSPYGGTSNQMANVYLAADMVGIIQDQRGCFNSGGNYSFWRKDGEDAYDVMEWISQQPWSNGKVFTTGVSADGITQYANAVVPNPWHKGAFVQWATATGHETVYWGGAFREGLIESWLTLVGFFTNGGAWTELEAVKDNEQKTSWWDPIQFDERYGDNINYASIHLGAWWDIFGQGTVDAREGFAEWGLEAYRDQHHLFMSPLGHCSLTGWADGLNYPDMLDGVIAAWLLSFEKFAEQTTGPVHDSVDMVNLYVMGSLDDPAAPGNYWTSLPALPSARDTIFYMHSNGELLPTRPTGTSALSYVYDPDEATPTTGGNNLFLQPCGPQDLREEVESRDDTLSFTSAPMTEDTAIVGNLFAKLFVESTATDTDFMVWVTDVAPDGSSSVMMRYGAVRMRWRDSREDAPQPMRPGEVYEVDVDLWSTAYILGRGHSVRVTVGSSNYPHYSLNRNNGRNIQDQEGAPTVVARNTVHLAAGRESSLSLPVVPLSAIPPSEGLRDLVHGNPATATQ